MKKQVVINKADALAVIDGQVDFVLPSGALYVSGVDGECSHEEIVTNILDLNKKGFGFRFTTEDSHQMGSVEFSIYPPHCVTGTKGQKYVKQLQGMYELSDVNIIKGDDPHLIAYSVGTSSQFASLVASLRRKNVGRVFVTGWAYTHCAGESAIAFAVQGFETYLVRDASRSVAPPYGDALLMKRKLELYGVKEIATGDII